MKDQTKKELQEIIDNQQLLIDDLETKLDSIKNRTSKRKQEVLNLLQTKPISIFDMSVKLDITNKNVSSQLCYLKKDGYLICTNSQGQKFFEDYDYSKKDEDDSLVEDNIEE